MGARAPLVGLPSARPVRPCADAEKLTDVKQARRHPNGLRFKLATWLGVLLLFTGAAAQNTDLASFLGALEGRPELEAARAAVRAAEANLAGAGNPVAFDLNASSSAPAADLIPFSDTRLGVGVRAYPFRYGEPGELFRLRELELAGARLGAQEALAQLEVRAFASALEAELSRETLALARDALAAAEAGYASARLRAGRGVATAGELRLADLARQGAENALLNAEAGAALAAATLTELAGSARPRALPELAPPQGTATELRRAELALQAAQTARAGAARAFYPVAEVAYDYDVSGQNRLSASLSTRDLAPRVGYSFDYDGFGAEARLSLSVSATLAPEQFDNAARLAALEEAAAATLRAAAQNTAATERGLRGRLAATERDEAFAALVLADAERTLAEVRERERLGVGTPLETQTAALALADAGLGAAAARRARVGALLGLYEFFGQPLSGLVTPLERP